MAKKVTATDMFNALGHAGKAVVLIGLIKKIDGSEEEIAFSQGKDCSYWINIPIDLVDGTEFLQTIRCGDHAHPLVRLTLKQPTSSDAQVFAAVANHLATSTATSLAQHAAFTSSLVAPAAAPCTWRYVWDLSTQSYVWRCA